MKNVFQVHLWLCNCNNIVVIKLVVIVVKRAQIVGSTNNLVWCSQMRASPQEKETSFEADHVSWIKDAGCEKETVG